MNLDNFVDAFNRASPGHLAPPRMRPMEGLDKIGLSRAVSGSLPFLIQHLNNRLKPPNISYS